MVSYRIDQCLSSRVPSSSSQVRDSPCRFDGPGSRPGCYTAQAYQIDCSTTSNELTTFNVFSCDCLRGSATVQYSTHPKRNVEAEEKTVDAVYMKRRPIFGRSRPHNGQKKNSTTAKMLKIQELSFSVTPFFAACALRAGPLTHFRACTSTGALYCKLRYVL